MDISTGPVKSSNARTLLLPYTLTLMVSMGIVQVVVALSDGQITLIAATLTALVALGIAGWLWRHYRSLVRVRFGVAIAHTIAFSAVTTSFNLHAVLRTFAIGGGANGFQDAAHELLATPWFGVTLVMSSVWGLGLLVHLLGVVLGRGWED